MSRRVKLTLMTLLLSFTLTSGVGVVAYQTADALGPLAAAIGRTLIRNISLKHAEKRDRNNINVRRDAELGEVALRVKAVDVQVQKGWMSAATAQRERERYARLSEAITERAKRERQITSFQTRQRIRQNLRNTFTDALKITTGVDPRAIDLLAGLLRGEKPVTAIINAAVSGGQPAADPRQPFRDLQAQLKEVEKAARALGGAKGIAIRARVNQMLRETAGIAEGEGEIPDDKLQRLRELDGKIGTVMSTAKSIGKDLFPGSEGIRRTRFAGEERYDRLDAAVHAQEGPLAGRVLISSLLRNALEDVENLAEAEGLTLTQDQIDAMAKAAITLWQDQKKRDPDSDLADLPFDELLRAAVNTILATGGADPLSAEDAERGEDSQQPAVGGQWTALVVMTWNLDADIDLLIINLNTGESGFVTDVHCTAVHADGKERREEFLVQGAQTFKVEIEMFTGCGQRENKSASETDFQVVIVYPDSPGYPGGETITEDGFIAGENTIVEVGIFNFQPN